MPEPWHTDALAGGKAGDGGSGPLDPPDDLVAGNQGQAGRRKFAVHDMQVGPADPAGLDPDQHFLRARRRLQQILRLQQGRSARENHGAHP